MDDGEKRGTESLGASDQPAMPEQCKLWERGWAKSMPPLLVSRAVKHGVVRRECVIDLLPDAELTDAERKAAKKIRESGL